jgi:hypothetical protein
MKCKNHKAFILKEIQLLPVELGLREEAPDEILNFVSFYHKSYGTFPECLVFDSKLTTYKNLDVLDKDFHIKFLTLKRRGKNIFQDIAGCPRITLSTKRHTIY